MTYQYRKKQLSKNEQKVYEKIFHGLENVKREIPVGVRSFSKIEKIMDAVIEDHPEIFYVSGGQVYVSALGSRIEPKYNYSKNEIDEKRWACEVQRESVLNGPVYTNPMMIALRIHNLLGVNVKYKETGKEAHSIVGPLLDMEAVCEGYAKAMKYLLDGYGIPCMVVKGTAKGSSESAFEPHGWILAYINGRWRHIDPTFDCTLSYGKQIREDYFQLTDDEIQKDHCWDRQRYPKAVRDY